MNKIPSVMATHDLMKQNHVEKLAQQKVKKEEELRQVSSEFESLFVHQMLEVMQNSVPESEVLPKSNGEKIFRSMLNQEYANMAAQSGKFGLGEMIYQELKPQLDE